MFCLKVDDEVTGPFVTELDAWTYIKHYVAKHGYDYAEVKAHRNAKEIPDRKFKLKNGKVFEILAFNLLGVY